MSSGALLAFWIGLLIGMAFMGLTCVWWVALHERKRHPNCRLPSSWKVWW